MGVCRFDGVDDRVRWTTLTAALANVSDGAWTAAVLLRRAAIGSFDGITYMLDATGVDEEAGYSFENTADTVLLDALVGGSASFTPQFTSITDTIILAVSKAAGSAVPRLGDKNVTSGSAWRHTAGSGAITDGNAAAILAIGAWEGSDPLDAWVGLVGWWEGAMSDVQKEELSVNKRTSDWWNHSFGQPKFLCQFDVDAASLGDIAANASGLATFGGGPTNDPAVTLENWIFDGLGAGPTSLETITVAPQKGLGAF